jgi:hypothetical protein
MTVRWLAETRDEEAQLLYRIGREDGALVAEWPHVARLRCVPGAEPELVADASADRLRFAKLRQGIARALVRSLDGGVTLHASAVEKRGRAVVCLGPSGAGKSTMASMLGARVGFALLADDMCEVRWADASPGAKLLAVPSETEVWLAADAAIKRPVRQPASSTVAEVAALVCMSAAPEAAVPRLERIGGSSLFGRLIPCMVRFALDDVSAHAREIEVLARLSRTPAYELIRSRDPAGAADAADLLAGLVTWG